MGRDNFVPAQPIDVLGDVLGGPKATQIQHSLRYDYSLIAAEQRNTVIDAAIDIVGNSRKAKDSLIAIGQRLTHVKGLLDHGQFSDWCATEFDMSQRTAQNMMNVAKTFGGKNETVSLLSDSALYLLAAPSVPEAAREAVIELAQTNRESPTKTEVKRIIDSHKPPPVLNTAPPLAAPTPANGNGHVGYSFDRVVAIATNHVQRGQAAANNIFDDDMSDDDPLDHLMLDDSHKELVQKLAANHAISDEPNYDGDEWYTPAKYIEAARQLMGGIDLDPASCDEAQEVVQAGAYFTKEDNGLAEPWFGCVWLNPPYSMPLIRQFVTKLIEEHDAGNVTEAVILTNNSSDTAWFHDLLSRYPACFTRGRVQFWRANHETFGTRQGQTLFYLGENVAAFRDTFACFGLVVTRL